MGVEIDMAWWGNEYVAVRRKKWRYPGVPIPFRLRHRYIE